MQHSRMWINLRCYTTCINRLQKGYRAMMLHRCTLRAMREGKLNIWTEGMRDVCLCTGARHRHREREREIGTPPGVDMAHEKVVVELVSMDLDVLPEGL